MKVHLWLGVLVGAVRRVVGHFLVGVGHYVLQMFQHVRKSLSAPLREGPNEWCASMARLDFHASVDL